MVRLDIDMPLGCIYEKNGKTQYCPICNHDDVPFCQFLDDDEVAIGIDERPCYCPLSAEPEPKTGRWIEFPNHNAFKCSECGRLILTTDGKYNVLKHYPYCHCGCKMEVEHETDSMAVL